MPVMRHKALNQDLSLIGFNNEGRDQYLSADKVISEPPNDDRGNMLFNILRRSKHEALFSNGVV
jgi:hypothetical protein